jgi:hypothetical protein
LLKEELENPEKTDNIDHAEIDSKKLPRKNNK